jgi:hypothetical protein
MVRISPEKSPIARALVGVALGVGAGMVAALVTPRRTPPPPAEPSTATP